MVDYAFKETKIVDAREASTWVSVPQSNSSRDEAVQV